MSKLAGLTPHVLTVCSEFNRPFTNFFANTIMTIRTDDPTELFPWELDPWPPSDADIEMMERWLKDQEDLENTVPSAAERNRSLK